MACKKVARLMPPAQWSADKADEIAWEIARKYGKLKWNPFTLDDAAIEIAAALRAYRAGDRTRAEVARLKAELVKARSALTKIAEGVDGPYGLLAATAADDIGG
jgi:hypothetical protein